MTKVVLNLVSGEEHGECATIALLVATAAQGAGHDVLVFATQEAVRLGYPGAPERVAVQEGRPAYARRGRDNLHVLSAAHRARPGPDPETGRG